MAALVLVGGTALAVTYTTSTRANFKLNKANGVATALTALVSNAAGPALTLVTDSTDSNATPLKLQTQDPNSQAPMQVDSDTKVANLNSDEVDGSNIYHGRLSMPPSPFNNLILDVPGFGQLAGSCNVDGQYQLQWFNSSQQPEAWWFDKDGVGYREQTAFGFIPLTPFTTADDVVVLQVGTEGRTATITATGHVKSTGCNFSAQAVAQID